MQGKLTRDVPASIPFDVVRAEAHHHRLFAWGNWEGAQPDGAALRVEVSADAGIHWFPYHEGVYSEVEEEDDDVHEELELPTLAEDGYLILKDIAGLKLRVILLEAGVNAAVEFRLV